MNLCELVRLAKLAAPKLRASGNYALATLIEHEVKALEIYNQCKNCGSKDISLNCEECPSR